MCFVGLATNDKFPIPPYKQHLLGKPPFAVYHFIIFYHILPTLKVSSAFQDLSKLGRKLDRVLMIDHDPVAFELQAENMAIKTAWEG